MNIVPYNGGVKIVYGGRKVPKNNKNKYPVRYFVDGSNKKNVNKVVFVYDV